MIISDEIYGNIELGEPVILELVETPAMQRLRGVDQNSVADISHKPWGQFTRFDHSVGVMFLIKKLGGSLEEQIAGLLHDISHTAFSHAMDFVFGSQQSQDFHEKHIERIIRQSSVPAILKKYGYDTERVMNHHNFSILEQDIPALCADRVDYALKTFATSFKVPASELQMVLSDLKAQGGVMVFQHREVAKKFADLFLRGDLEVWGGSYFGNAIYHLFAQIVKAAHMRGEVTLDDFFTTDDEFMEKLSPDSKKQIEKLRALNFSEVDAASPYDLHLNAKTRYVDPPVKTNSGMKKLSEIDSDFRAQLDKFLARRALGNYVKILA